MGYHRAGFEVVGIDIETQKHYPFEFIQADFFEYVREHGHKFDVIHASPPCQAYSRAGAVHKNKHPHLIAPTRELLIATGLPYVIENVEGAPLKAVIFLCGTMFGLKTRRHRWFESNIDLGFPPYTCQCQGKASAGELLNYHNTKQRNAYLVTQSCSGSVAFKKSLGVEWMNFYEAQEAIPPAYSEYIGRHPMASLIREIQ